MSHLCNLGHHEKFLKNFLENSFLKNDILERWSEALIVSILTYSSNDN